MEMRLGILLDNNVIDKQSHDACLMVHNQIMKPKNLNKLESYQVAITHLAMALQRIKNDDIVGEMDGAILEEIVNAENFNLVKELSGEIISLMPIDIPQSEISYIWLHLLNLLNEERGSLWKG